MNIVHAAIFICISTMIPYTNQGVLPKRENVHRVFVNHKDHHALKLDDTPKARAKHENLFMRKGDVYLQEKSKPHIENVLRTLKNSLEPRYSGKVQYEDNPLSNGRYSDEFEEPRYLKSRDFEEQRYQKSRDYEEQRYQNPRDFEEQRYQKSRDPEEQRYQKPRDFEEQRYQKPRDSEEQRYQKPRDFEEQRYQKPRNSEEQQYQKTLNYEKHYYRKPRDSQELRYQNPRDFEEQSYKNDYIPDELRYQKPSYNDESRNVNPRYFEESRYEKAHNYYDKPQYPKSSSNLESSEKVHLKKSLYDIDLPTDYNEKGMAFITKPKDDPDKKINKLMNKIIKYKMEAELPGHLRQELEDVFSFDELEEMKRILAAFDKTNLRQNNKPVSAKSRHNVAPPLKYNNFEVDFEDLVV